MNWIIKAALQKILAANRVGDRINHFYGSFQRNYYPDSVEYGFKELLMNLELVESFGHPFKNLMEKEVLEIGTGYSLVQSVILKLIGWHGIMTVDITRDIFFKAVEKQLKYLLQDKILLVK